MSGGMTGVPRIKWIVQFAWREFRGVECAKKRKHTKVVETTNPYNLGKFNVRMMCRFLDVAASGYFEWSKTPISSHAIENARLLRLIKALFYNS